MCVDCCSRKERIGVGWLLAGVWKMIGIGKKISQNSRCIVFEMMSNVYSETSEIRIRRTGILNRKWLTVKEDVACKKILRRTNKSLLIDLDRYMDEVHCRGFDTRVHGSGAPGRRGDKLHAVSPSVCPQYGNCFISHFWRLEFLGA